MHESGAAAGGMVHGRAQVRRIDASDRASVRAFVDVERRLALTYPLSVPPVRQTRTAMLAGETPIGGDERTMFLAEENGTDVACCAAFIDRSFQEHRNERVGFVGCFQMALEAQAAATSCLTEAERWLAGRGVEHILAPVDGSFFGGAFLRTAEFGSEGIFPFQWNPASYVDAFQRAGYELTYPEWAYYVDFGSAAYRQTSQAALDHARCVVRPVGRRRWSAGLEQCRQIYNDVFDESEWWFAPASSEEWLAALAPYRWVADPHLLMIADVDGEPAGFCIGAPNWGPLVRRLHGDLGALNSLRFLMRSRRYGSGALYLIGIRSEFRRFNVARTLAASIFRRFEELGLPGAEYCLVREGNQASRLLASTFGGSGRALYAELDKWID